MAWRFVGGVGALASGLTLLLFLGGCAGAPPHVAGGPDSAAIREVMVRLNKGRDSVNESVGRKLRENPVQWPELTPLTQEYATLTESLTHYSPDLGGPQSWAKLTHSFADDAKALDAAATKHDRSASLSAYHRLGASCKPCHDAHR